MISWEETLGGLHLPAGMGVDGDPQEDLEEAWEKDICSVAAHAVLAATKTQING